MSFDYFRRLTGADSLSDAGAAHLKAISPLTHAKQIVKPLLIMQGANDPAVLRSHSDKWSLR